MHHRMMRALVQSCGGVLDGFYAFSDTVAQFTTSLATFQELRLGIRLCLLLTWRLETPNVLYYLASLSHTKFASITSKKYALSGGSS